MQYLWELFQQHPLTGSLIGVRWHQLLPRKCFIQIFTSDRGLTDQLALTGLQHRNQPKGVLLKVPVWLILQIDVDYFMTKKSKRNKTQTGSVLQSAQLHTKVKSSLITPPLLRGWILSPLLHILNMETLPGSSSHCCTKPALTSKDFFVKLIKDTPTDCKHTTEAALTIMLKTKVRLRMMHSYHCHIQRQEGSTWLQISYIPIKKCSWNLHWPYTKEKSGGHPIYLPSLQPQIEEQPFRVRANRYWSKGKIRWKYIILVHS